MLSKKPTRRTGITHFPLEDEKISQREVPPRGKKKEGSFSNNQIRQKRTSPFEKAGKTRCPLFRE